MDLLDGQVYAPPLSGLFASVGLRAQERGCLSPDRETRQGTVTDSYRTPEVKALRSLFQEVMIKRIE